MPRTITVDGVDFQRMQLIKDPDGSIHIYAEYNVKAGTRVFQTIHEDITDRVTAQTRAAALALFDSTERDVTTVELSATQG